MSRFYFYKEKVSLAIASLSFVLIITFTFYTSHLYAKINYLQHRLSSLKYLAAQSQEATAFVKSHAEEFTAFEGCGFEHPLTPETLQSLQPHIIEFGVPSSVKEKFITNNIVTQEVCFSIPCLYDRDIFSHLDKLIHKGPGIFQINEVTIKRIRPLSEEVLAKVASGKPQVLFEGRIIATWIHQ